MVTILVFEKNRMKERKNGLRRTKEIEISQQPMTKLCLFFFFFFLRPIRLQQLREKKKSRCFGRFISSFLALCYFFSFLFFFFLLNVHR